MLDGKFIRGTTPTHTFELPIALDFVRDLTITYKQNGEVLVKRRLEDCDIHENIVAVTLDQQESLSFLPNEIAEVQLKLLTEGGRVVASPTYRIAVEDALDTEVFDI
jgi:hypothetical protein